MSRNACSNICLKSIFFYNHSFLRVKTASINHCLGCTPVCHCTQLVILCIFLLPADRRPLSLVHEQALRTRSRTFKLCAFKWTKMKPQTQKVGLGSNTVSLNTNKTSRTASCSLCILAMWVYWNVYEIDFYDQCFSFAIANGGLLQ